MLDEKRAAMLREAFDREFGGAEGGEPVFFSAPGRTEIGGNHTDHNHGSVICGAVTLDTLALVRKADDNRVRLHSVGFDPCELSLDRLDRLEGEQNSVALIRGIAHKFAEKGLSIGGFDAVTQSQVLGGSGLSSSAAFECLVATIFDHLYNDGGMDPIEKAKIGQYAENVYGGKKSGLMDQSASCCGGLLKIDFASTENPVIIPIEYDFAASGHTVIVTGPIGGSHAGREMDKAYSDIPDEMKMVAHYFSADYLRDIEPERFYAALPELMRNDIARPLPTRALLRAHHYFSENERVEREFAALENGDFDGFLAAVRESGRSSYMYLQNVLYSTEEQDLGMALAMSEWLLAGRGATRVHGGGFAGTIQAFVPDDMADGYAAGMEAIFGKDACFRLSIRREGGIKIG